MNVVTSRDTKFMNHSFLTSSIFHQISVFRNLWWVFILVGGGAVHGAISIFQNSAKRNSATTNKSKYKIRKGLMKYRTGQKSNSWALYESENNYYAIK